MTLRGSALYPLNGTADAQIGNPGVLPQFTWPRAYGWLDIAALLDEGAVPGRVVGLGSVVGLNYVDVRYQGTAPSGPGGGGNALYSGTLFCPGGIMFCRKDQIVDFSVSLALVAGSLSGIASIRLAIDEHAPQPGNEYLATLTSSDFKSGLHGRLSRFSAPLTMSHANCDSAAGFVLLTASPNEAVDITLRLGMPALR